MRIEKKMYMAKNLKLSFIIISIIQIKVLTKYDKNAFVNLSLYFVNSVTIKNSMNRLVVSKHKLKLTLANKQNSKYIVMKINLPFKKTPPHIYIFCYF